MKIEELITEERELHTQGERERERKKERTKEKERQTENKKDRAQGIE
jgi:hypothetical protein